MGPSSAISGPSRAYRPSWSLLGSILRHLSVTIDEDRRCIVDFAKFAPRLHESAILSILASSWDHLGAIFGPSWDVSGRSWLILGPLRVTLGPLGPSRREDRRRHSRFSKIRTSLTREHHSEVVLRLQFGPFCGHRRTSRGHVLHLRHLGGLLGHLGAISGSFYVYLAQFRACDFARPMMHS